MTSSRTVRKKPKPRRIKTSDAEEIYGLHAWGAGYFKIGPDGNLRVHPTKEQHLWVDLHQVVTDLAKKRTKTPLVLRFPQMLSTQVELLHAAFHAAIEEFEYDGAYRGVFPIKVNQMEPVISALVDCGTEHGYSLEAGTKPELALALAAGLPAGSLVICNGYKDQPYVELALAGVSLGYEVLLVVEKYHELELILRTAKRLGVRPSLGLRLRVHARGRGKWAKSGGDASKFGLNTAELLEAVAVCEREGWSDRLRLLHFHIGSQVTDVRRIKTGVTEGARFYAAMRSKGIDIEYLDVGGGLGVDYDGSGTASDSSVNYSVQEYANDVVYTVKEVCDEEGVPVPHLVSESGRAVSAYHAMTIFTVEQQQTAAAPVPLPPMPEEIERCLTALIETRDEMSRRNFGEYYHDALQSLDELHMLFRLGKLSLEERAIGEAIAAQVFRDVVYFAKLSGRRIPEEIEELEQEIATKYVCNFSIFQSLPDFWAIEQLFPICPIHRLDERPDVWATLVDITCDSDGKVDKFGGMREDEEAILLHDLDGKPYHIGAFLLGAYQDVMGCFHNLLGETNEATVTATGAGDYEVGFPRTHGQSCAEVVEQFGHDRRELRRRFADRLETVAEEEAWDDARRKRVLRSFTKVMSGTPYLA